MTTTPSNNTTQPVELVRLMLRNQTVTVRPDGQRFINKPDPGMQDCFQFPDDRRVRTCRFEWVNETQPWFVRGLWFSEAAWVRLHVFRLYVGGVLLEPIRLDDHHTGAKRVYYSEFPWEPGIAIKVELELDPDQVTTQPTGER
jgi:hypothetical protein